MSKNVLVHWVARLLNEKAYVFLTRRHQPLKHTISSKLRDRKWGIFSLCTSSLLTLYTLPCIAPDECTFQFIGRTTSKRHLPSGKSYYIHSSSCSEHYIKDNCLCWVCCCLLVSFGVFFCMYRLYFFMNEGLKVCQRQRFNSRREHSFEGNLLCVPTVIPWFASRAGHELVCFGHATNLMSSRGVLVCFNHDSVAFSLWDQPKAILKYIGARAPNHLQHGHRILSTSRFTLQIHWHCW